MFNVKNIKPKTELREYVRKISVFQSDSKLNFKHKLTPSAFTYLSYNHKDIPISYFGNKKVHPSGRLQIAGPKINEDIYVEYNGRLSQILVEFTASGFYYLFHHSPAMLSNCLTEINNFILPNEYDRLEKILLEITTAKKQVKVLEEFLVDKSFKAIPPLDYIEKSLKIIEEHYGNVIVNKLAQEVGIGRRQFDRKFQEVVGVTPKYYSKITQLNYVINLMAAKNYNSIQDLAFQAEYYDLSHFAHRFKELTGLTPNEFVDSDQHIAMKYFDDLLK